MSQFNQEAISEYIRNFKDFVIVTVIPRYGDENYYITPLEITKDRWIRHGVCFDNTDIRGKNIMGKSEMLLKFGLTYGKTVRYAITKKINDDFSSTYSKLMEI